MKVYIVTGEPFPNGMAATNRIKCYGKAIIAAGLGCEVLIFRRTEVFGNVPRNTSGQGSYGTLPYRYISSTPLRTSNILCRRLFDCIDALHTVCHLYRTLDKGDVIICYEGGHILLTLMLMRIAHAKGAFCVKELCEFPFGTGEETGRTVRLRKVVEKRLLPKLDGIICISDTLVEYAKKYISQKCKVIKIPILVDYDKFRMEDISDDDFPFIFHAGTLTEQKDGILGILEAFGRTRAELPSGIKLILAGNLQESPVKSGIYGIISKYGMQDSVVFTGYLNETEMRNHLFRASLIIVNKPASRQNHYGFSTKLGECTASGKPLIITDVGEVMNYLSNKVSALIVPHEDVESLSNAMVWAFSHMKEMRQYATKANQVCRENFDYKNWSSALRSLFTRLGQMNP